MTVQNSKFGKETESEVNTKRLNETKNTFWRDKTEAEKEKVQRLKEDLHTRSQALEHQEGKTHLKVQKKVKI